ncbi:1-deoxy-D-xylulose 5-phosphate reductoisomerase [[Eubacterium] infirmum]|nr:1-deoxy-D-xylulose 5-phosphate reductoisomerase [[Eubacterium] infirmum]
MKEISILGSTGSIGTQALDVVRKNRDKFMIKALSCGRNLELMKKQISEFEPELVVTATVEDAKLLREYFRGKAENIEFLSGEDGLLQLAGYDSDLLLNSLSGMRGMLPTYEAIKAGKNIALANKESLVVGGDVIMSAAAKNGVKILPVDSEHSAIFQCMQGNLNKEIKKIYLTASGGPFRGYSRAELEDVSVEQALNHPKWTMGRKISIDSATLMNKGLELIEAKWLFNVDVDDIEILVHPQSIVHSGVEFKDTAVIAQLGIPDMRIPIALAFTYPDRLKMDVPELNFFNEGSKLTFEKPDLESFKCLKLAIQAAKSGKLYPAAMNGANEVLVESFLNGEIGFNQIADFIEEVLNVNDFSNKPELDSILEADKLARGKAYDLIKGNK